MFRADLGFGAKSWLVVSNNQRNRNLDTVIAARITTTRKNAHLPTLIELSQSDPLVGFVLCDDLVQVYRDEFDELLGTLSVQTMQQVSHGLRVALP